MPVLTKYTYGTSGYDLHRLIQMKTDNDYIAWTYDPYGRMLTEKRNVDGAGLLEFSYAYGSNGQLETTTSPDGLRESNEYDPYGNLIQVSADAQSVWMLLSAGGTTTSSLLNGFMVASTTLNYQGTLTNLKTMSAPDIIPGATTLRNMDFVFDETTGNLTSRTGMIPQKETFYYDHLDRLTTVKHGSPETLAMTIGYSNKGNISSKTGIGAYRYNASKVHALEEVDNTDGLIPEGDQSITYNAFNKVSQITETAGDETRQLDITYGPDGQRWKTELRKNGNITKTVIYAGNYERVIKSDTTTHLYYMEGGGIHVKQFKGASTLLQNRMFYAHPDHLGSLTLITDAAGGTVQKCSFDAWGKRTFITKTPSLVFDRGFTGHEHLDEFGLINMNGRMYDPVVGRFLSPDPYVADGTYSQDYNRYSYARNNPLIYTDPDGEWVHIVIGAVIGGVVNLGIKAFQGKIHNFGDGLVAFGIGAAAGAVGALTGGAAFLAAGGGAAGAGGFAAGAVGGMVGSAFSMPILSVGNTAYFGDPLMTGQQYLTGIAVGGLLGGATNGITALVNGKTFWSGNVKPPPMTPATIRPELPSLNSSKPEVNTDGLRSRPLEMTPERPVFSETLKPGPITVKLSSELREVEIATKGTDVLSKSEVLRIQNAATRINKPIHVVGSRAIGKAGPYSDWDYIIEGGLNSKEWSTIKNSLPGARSILDNTTRMIDIHSGPVWPGYPYITIFPR